MININSYNTKTGGYEMMKILNFTYVLKIDKRFISTVLALLVMIVSTKGINPAPDKNPRLEKSFFNGVNLNGWTASDMTYWSVKDGAIVGSTNNTVKNNQFIWSDVEVKDFYLCVDILIEPNDRNAGIQFRSKREETGQAIGYQADIGKGVWGRLYHEHGRGKLDWTDRGEKAVKCGQWNRYEILAVGHNIWTAINGTLSVAVNDINGELEGHIAFQIHAGEPQTVKYRVVELVHNPKIKLGRYNKEELRNELKEITH